MLSYQAVKNWNFPPIPLVWGREEAARYALSINIGTDPLDRSQIALATGQSGHLFPTMAAILGRPGHWLSDPRTGVDHSRMLIGEVAFEVNAPLPVEGMGIARHRVVTVTDKGEGRGALVVVERQIIDDEGMCATVFRTTSFCRGDGGFSPDGGDPYTSPTEPFPQVQDSSVSAVTIQTLPQQALLFALNGDRNPIHIDPNRSARVGLRAPILHGMGTVGLLAAALLQRLGDPEGLSLKMLAGRFVSPVIPGCKLTLEWLQHGPKLNFRAREQESGKLVFDAGIILLHGRY